MVVKSRALCPAFLWPGGFVPVGCQLVLTVVKAGRE